MLIGSAGLQIPSVWSHVFKTGWGAELLNFFFSSGSQGLEVAEDDMQTELGGLGKILCKQHCSSKSSTKHCTSVCPYKTNGIWTPLMGLRNKLFSNKCLYNRSGKEGPGHQRKWDSAGPICQRKPGGGVGGGRSPQLCLMQERSCLPGGYLILDCQGECQITPGGWLSPSAFSGWSKSNSMRHSTEASDPMTSMSRRSQCPHDVG